MKFCPFPDDAPVARRTSFYGFATRGIAFKNGLHVYVSALTARNVKMIEFSPSSARNF